MLKCALSNWLTTMKTWLRLATAKKATRTRRSKKSAAATEAPVA